MSMAARTLTAGLSPQDLDGIRNTLAAGRKPKVVFTDSAGQIAGQAGQVVELRDPRDDEWVVVRFGRDELPFAPTDLVVPPRGDPKRTVTRRTADATPVGTPSGPPLATGLAGSAASGEIPPQRQETSMSATTAAAPARAPAAVRSNAPAAPEAGKAARKAPAPRPAKAKAPPSLTVTLSYTDGDWFVGAQQGAKSLAKPYAIKAAEALRLVALLDVPGLHDAVEHIIEAERAAANAHVERLRAELAEIEARLADLPTLP
jgi:hypothetical protein